MSVLGRLLLLVVVAAVLELVVLVELGQAIGIWALIGVLVLMGLAGAALARMEGFRVMLELQRDLARGRLPGRSVLDGAAVLVAAVLLFVPGLLSDAAAFLLLLPPTRRWIQRLVLRRLERGLRDGTIRVIGSGIGAGAPGFGGFTGFGGPARARRPREDVELDPAREIVIEQDER
ncbi:MAG TPA: FxsA family protein [Longimicrobiales bacterium]|nr:FxsA family protein [Longimicrobiales bacterium]